LLARKSPEKQDQLSRRLFQWAGILPASSLPDQLAKGAPRKLILHPIARRALGKMILYQLSGSCKAGISLLACQEATPVWYPQHG
jgi:hypothetical protein